LNELSINIHIAGRSYPLTVLSHEEENLRIAGKLIQDKLQQYMEQFNLRDQQDALAMYALEITTGNMALRNKIDAEENETTMELEQTERLLSHIQL